MEAAPSRPPLASWQEFLAFYEAAHRDPVNRGIHHLTHVGAAAGAVLLAAGRPGAAALLLLPALPINWVGHWLFERNTPAFLAAGDPWARVQIALGGLGWTAVTFWHAVGGGRGTNG